MVLSLWSGVIHWVLWQSPDTPVMSCFLCECVASSVLDPCVLSSACLVWCWSMVFGSRYSCLEFWFRVRVRTLALRVLSHFVSVRSLIRSAACSSVHVCYVMCCCRQFVFYRLHAFMLCFVLCGMQLVYFIGCVLSCCHVLCEHVAYEYSSSSFAHGWRFVLLAICLCFCFVWAHGFCLSFLCAMCSHVNCLDPTHLVSWFLVNLPHLSSLVTLLVYSLYNLLVFPVLPCQACQACQLCCFSPTG